MRVAVIVLSMLMVAMIHYGTSPTTRIPLH